MSKSKVSLRDALTAADVVKMGGKPMLVDVILGKLDAGERDILLEALHGPRSSTRISKALESVGHPVSESAVKRWREKHGAR